MRVLRIIAFICAMLLLFSGCKSIAPVSATVNETIDTTPETTTPPPSPTLEPVSDKNYDASSQLIGLVIDKSDGMMSLAAIHGFLRTSEILGYPAVLFDANTPEEAVSRVDEAVSTGCSGILVWANTPELFAAAKKAKDAGVHVVIPYFKDEYVVADANLAPDPADYAAEAARIMCEQIKVKKRDAGTIAVVGSQQYSSIASAFEETVKSQYPGYKVDMIGENVNVNDYVSSHKNLVGVLALKPNSARMWYEAYSSLEKPASTSSSDTSTKKPKSTSKSTKKPESTSKSSATPKATAAPTGRIKPVIIALDYTDTNVALVKNGTIFALIARPYYDSTAQSMAVIDRILRGIPTQTQVRLNAPIIRQNSVDKYSAIIDEIKEWFKL